ncbi:MAG: type II toxin-antitoxin system prevent-host-death family antitoxin [Thermoanaerobaculia bacterium]
MKRETTYSAARANLAALCDEVAEGTEPVYITRRGAATVALISAAELRGLEETAHLLRSPANARRLLAALERARKGQGQRLTAAGLKKRARIEPEK